MKGEEIKFVQNINIDNQIKSTVQQGKYNLLYFLYKEDRLVYIGQTTNHIFHSIDRHQRDNKIFTHYSIIEVDKELNLKTIEELCIDKFTPELNKDHKFQKKRRLLAKNLGISYEEAVKLKIEITL